MNNDFLEKFAKDIIEHIYSDNSLEKILYGHLHIECILTSILECGIFRPSSLDLKGMNFSTKVKWSVAVGLVDSDIEPPLKKLGKIRNSVAHRLDFELLAKDELDFANVIKKSQLKEKIQKKQEESEGSKDNFSSCIYVLWFYLMEQYLKILKNRKLLVAFPKEVVTCEPDEISNRAPESFQVSYKNFMKSQAI